MFDSAWSDTEGPFREQHATPGWVRYREQVVDMCCTEPQMLTFLIISASLSSKESFIINEGVSFCFFRCRKNLQSEGAKGSSAITFLLLIVLWQSVKINVANMSALWRWNGTREKGAHREKEYFIWEGGRAEGEAVSVHWAMTEMMNKSLLSSFYNKRGRTLTSEGKSFGPHKTCTRLALSLGGTLRHTER